MHLLRAVFGSRKRFCPACFHRWMEGEERFLARRAILTMALTAALTSMAIYFLPFWLKERTHSREDFVPREVEYLFGGRVPIASGGPSHFPRGVPADRGFFQSGAAIVEPLREPARPFPREGFRPSAAPAAPASGWGGVFKDLGTLLKLKFPAELSRQNRKSPVVYWQKNGFLVCKMYPCNMSARTRRRAAIIIAPT
jgi:hypothetical protein